VSKPSPRPAEAIGEVLTMLHDAQQWARKWDATDDETARKVADALLRRSRARIEDIVARMKIEGGGT
jgi:hypothetical protein